MIRDSRDRDLARRALSEPDDYPDRFKSWLLGFLTDNANLRLSYFQLPRVDLQKNLPYAAGWADFGGTYMGGVYYKDPLGFVHVEGAVANGGAPASGTNIATIPYHPAAKQAFVITTNTGVGRVDIDALGQIIYISGGVTFLSLSGIVFRSS